MKVGEAYPSKYLKSEDMDDVDVVVTIKHVTQEMVGSGEDQERKLIVYFREMDRGLCCNKTNANMIAGMYGDETDDWPGKRITLWVNHDVTFGNRVVSAIRVRSKTPAGATTARPAPARSSGHMPMTFDQAVALCATVNIDRAALVAHLKSLGRKGWNGQRDERDVQDLVSGFQPPPDDNGFSDANEDAPFGN